MRVLPRIAHGQIVGGVFTIENFNTDVSNGNACAPVVSECVETFDDCPAAPVGNVDGCNVCSVRGRPTSLTFEVTGGSASGSGSLQNGKGGATGSTIAGGGTYTVTCQNARAQLSGTTLTVRNFNDNDIFCRVTGGGGEQTIQFHTSCSKRLVTGDQFGALRLDSFVNSAGGTAAQAGCGPQEAPPCRLCCYPTAEDCPACPGSPGYGRPAPPCPECEICCEMNPPEITYDELDRTVQCDGMGNSNDINAWVNSFACTDDTTMTPAFTISPNPIEFTGDSCNRIAHVNFSCVDDCDNGVSIVGSLRIVDTEPPRVVQHAVDRTVECDGSNNPPALQDWLRNYGGFRAHDVCQGSCTSGSQRRDRRQWNAGYGGHTNPPPPTPYPAPPPTQRYQPPPPPSQSAPPPSTPAPSADTSCDNVTLSYSTPTFSTPAGYQDGHPHCHRAAPVTFTAVDACGNAVADIKSFSITDTTAPSITAPNSPIVECNAQTADIFQQWLATRGGCTAHDACTGITWTTSPANPQLPDLCNGNVHVNFIATDDCGQSSQASGTFRVRDSSAADVMQPPQQLEVDCDLDENDPTYINWLDNHGGMVVRDACPHDGHCAGGYTDSNQAETDHSECTCGANYAQPVCLDGNKQYENICFMWCHNGYVGDRQRISNGACNYHTSQPECDDEITWAVTIGGEQACADGHYESGNTNGNLCPRCKPVTFTATDACGNSVSRSTEIRLVDETAPVFTLEAQDGITDSEVTLNDDLAAWREANGHAIASDGCGEVTWTNRQSHDFTGDCPEVSTWVFTATDDCGNAATTTANFRIRDRSDPEISGGEDLSYNCDAGCDGFDFHWQSDARRLVDVWVENIGCLQGTDCSNIEWSMDGVPTGDLCGQSGTTTFTLTDRYGHTMSRDLNYNFPRIDAPACNICGRQYQGGSKPSIQALELRYSGPGSTTVTVQSLGSFPVSSGQTFEISTSGGSFKHSSNSWGGNNNRLPTNTIFNVNGVSTTLHTSCSQPIFTGQAIGSQLSIVGFTTSDGTTDEIACPSGGSSCTPPDVCGISSPTPSPTTPAPTPCVPSPTDVCYTSGSKVRPSSLMFRYEPGTTLSRNQNGKASVSGSVTGSATITCDSGVASPMTVSPGDDFVLRAPSGRFEAQTTCTLTGSGFQRISIHTSCSYPLRTGDFFGSFQLTGFNGQQSSTCGGSSPVASPGHGYQGNNGGGWQGNNGGGWTPPTTAPPSASQALDHPNTADDDDDGRQDDDLASDDDFVDGEEICETRDTRIESITFQYNGFVGQDSYDDSQKPTIQDLRNPRQRQVKLQIKSKNSASFEFGRYVLRSHPLNQHFTVFGARDLGNLGAFIKFKISGRQIRFVTNCNAQLRVGDQFGALKITGYTLLAGRERLGASTAGTSAATGVASATIAGVVIGVLFVVALIGGTTFYVIKGRRPGTNYATTASTKSTDDMTASEQGAAAQKALII